jgi:PAS domain S-box-containing protein
MSQGIDDDADALRQVLAAIPEVVVVLDREGMIRYLNHVEEGYVREDLIGSQAEAIMVPESKDVFRNALRSVFDQGGEEEYESKVVDPHGEMQWYRSMMRPVYKNGDVVAAMLMATNITELKESQTLIRQLERLLPICSWCDRIRSETGEWETVEEYLASKADTLVSHGICPKCVEGQLEGGGEEAVGPNGSAA